MNTYTCDTGATAPADVLDSLHPNQGGAGRHRCVICAYSLGYQDNKSYAVSELEYCKEWPEAWAPANEIRQIHEKQASNVRARHTCAVCAYFEGRLAQLDGVVAANIKTEILATDEAGEYFVGDSEGHSRQVTHIQYERKPKNRAVALAFHGPNCLACGFNFDATYTAAHARGYIEMHHVIPVSQLKGRVLDVRENLIPLCANCHKMAHRTNPPLSVDEIKKLLATARGD